jgi:hypothetical protein
LAVKAGVQFGVLVDDCLEDRVDVTYIPVVKYGYSPTHTGNFDDPRVEKLYHYDERSFDVNKSIDFGIPVGLSYEYKNITLDARYYFGLTKTDATPEPDNIRNRYASITLGYRFHL